MSGDEPFAGHDGGLLVLLLLALPVALVWLTFAGVSRLFRALVRRTSPLSAAALLTWGAAVGFYTWGLVLLMMTDDYGEAMACEEVAGSHHVIGYQPTFLPLTFGCVIDDGRVVDVIVPSWVDLSVFLLGFCASVLTAVRIVRRWTAERSAL